MNMPEGVDHKALFDCIDIALKKAKQVTNIVEKAWEERNKGFGMLDLINEELAI
jgi:hypothetical protein